MKEGFLNCNNCKLYYYLVESENPKGVVQIIHGMQEHAKRYIPFMEFLQRNGYTVFASDLRGHGNSIETIPGYSDGDIFQEIVQDQIEITKYLKDKYKTDVYVFGHSFGSFITQNYITHKDISAKKIILCGSTYTKNILFRFGKLFAKITCLFKGKKCSAKFIEKMSLNGYGKNFENGNWLSRDEQNWEAYKKDKFCGQSFPANFYLSMFKNSLKNYKNINNINIPILIISGTSDPVSGKNAKGAIKLYNKYKNANKDVSIILYENARHELLNEINKNDVYNDILNFIEK